MAKKENTILDVIRGISQALVNKHDGYDDQGNRIEIGLKREKGNPMIDSRQGLMDGFGVAFSGDQLCIKYHGEVNMKDLHKNGPKKFERELEDTMASIVKYIKKEYKKAADGSLTLKPAGEVKASIQRMSNIRNWVQAKKCYDIGGLSDVVPSRESGERTIDNNIKKFLELSSKKKPQNVTRKDA